MLGLDKIGQVRDAQQQVRDLLNGDLDDDSPVYTLLAAWAGIERETREQHVAICEALEDAGHIDGVALDDPRPVDDRVDELVALLPALMKGRTAQHYLEHHTAVDDPDRAAEYVALDDDAWQEQIETWATTYRQQDPDRFDGVADRQVAAAHVRRVFGVDLQTFEAEVVAIEEADTVQKPVYGPLEGGNEAIEQATDQLENSTEDN